MSDTRSNSARLSGKTTAILAMIAAGNSYEQILRAYPDFTYNDIFNAADEALSLSEGRLTEPGAEQTPEKAYSVAKIRCRYPKAYQAWSDEEEQQLRELISSGHTVAQIAGRLERQRSAIRSRIMRLGLRETLTPKEQERFARIALRTAHAMPAEVVDDD